jgi:hypothetical protein
MSKYPVNEEMAAKRDAERAEERSTRIDVGDLRIGPQEAGQDVLKSVKALTDALEAGGYNASPAPLEQGCSLKVEDLNPVMQHVTYDTKHIKLYRPDGTVLTIFGERIKPIPADKLEFLPAFERVVEPDIDASRFRFVTMAVATPKKNVIIDNVRDPGPNDQMEVDGYDPITVTAGALTKKTLEDAAYRVMTQYGQPDPPLLLSPAQYNTYKTLMSSRAWTTPPQYTSSRCLKCGSLACNCYDVEETPKLDLGRLDDDEPKKPAPRLADSIDFDFVPTPEERKKKALAKLDTFADGVQGACYACAHPRRLAYPHKQTRMRFCSDCAVALLS